jgi:hypothetical protein
VKHQPHLYIDGAWAAPAAPVQKQAINPTNGRPVAPVVLLGAAA